MSSPSRIRTGLAYGALAGAAGATALNGVTYLDQALRGRPSGSTPQDTVQKIADTAGTDIPGDQETKENRKEGLGPLAGLGVGVGLGALAGVLRVHGVRTPKWLAPIALGLGAMVVSDGTMTALGVTDPKSWTPGSVVADAVPHLVYGMTTVGALHRMLDPETAQVR